MNAWVVLQKLPQLSDTHFSQVLNKLEKNFFHGFIKYHLIQVSPSPNNNSMDFKVKSSIVMDVGTHVFNFYLPQITMITNIIEKSKNHDIVGALGYMLTYHRAPERSLYGL